MKYFIGIITVHDYEMHETYVYETKIFKSSKKNLNAIELLTEAIELLTETVKSELLTELEEAGYSSCDGDDDDLLKEHYCIGNIIREVFLFI